MIFKCELFIVKAKGKTKSKTIENVTLECKKNENGKSPQIVNDLKGEATLYLLNQTSRPETWVVISDEFNRFSVGKANSSSSIEKRFGHGYGQNSH